MKIKCSKQEILKPLQICSSLISASKDLYPICECVRITATKEKISFRATDLKMTITCTIPTKNGESVLEEGDLAVPVINFHNLIKELDDAEISLEKEKQKVIKITATDSEFVLSCKDVSKFPEIPEFKEDGADGAFEIEGPVFLKLIEQTAFAGTAERSRYDLENTLIELNSENHRICFVATDGKRMACCEKKVLAFGKAKKDKYTIPIPGLRQLEKVIKTINPNKVFFSFMENHFLCRLDDITISIRLADSIFPAYQKVIPTRYDHKGSIPVREFSTALKKLAVMNDGNHNEVDMKFEDKILTIYAKNAAIGTANVKVPITFIFGAPDLKKIVVRVNITFLRDFLKAMKLEKISIEFEAPLSCILFREGEDYRYIVLPIRTNEHLEEDEEDGDNGDDSDDNEASNNDKDSDYVDNGDDKESSEEEEEDGEENS